MSWQCYIQYYTFLSKPHIEAQSGETKATIYMLHYGAQTAGQAELHLSRSVV